MSGGAEAARARLACAVAERMAAHLIPNNFPNESRELYNLCLSLSRCIDYAVANGEVLPVVKNLPYLLKQICHRSKDSFLRAAIMVLMISAKSACKIGWFSDTEKAELLALANEIGSCFCNLEDVILEDVHSSPKIPELMTRFLPQMRMGQIIASLDIKPGYGAYMVDFHISKQTKNLPNEKIRLFVAQIDNTETSTCLVSPLQANFLINGKAVERRTNIFVDPGPQIPTIVTSMLKYGTNLLQAIGQFDGHYIILVAYMSLELSTDISLIQDYVQPPVAAPDLDSDIIEGPSRISLNCPISFTRIKTPVKGCACKHHQCFDFSNYVAINSKRPSWRCPHCYQYVCYLDIRIDQNIAKVLKEVGSDVSAVTIADNGSWRAVESNKEENNEKGKETSSQKDGVAAKELNGSADALPGILDLTDDDMIYDAGTCETEDRKPSDVNLLNVSVTCNQSSSATQLDQNVSGRVDDAFYSGVYVGQGSSTLVDRSPTTLITDAVSTMSHRGLTEHGYTDSLQNVMQNQLSDSLQLQQIQFPNPAFSNEHGRAPPIPRNVNRIPIAIQALPAHSQMPSSQQRSRVSPSAFIPSGSSLLSHAAPPRFSSADGLRRVNNNLGRQQQFPRADMNPLQRSSGTSKLPVQSFGEQSSPVVPGPGINRTPGSLTNYRNSHLQQALNGRMPTNPSPNIPPSSQLPQQTQIQQAGTQLGVGSDAGSLNSYLYSRKSSSVIFPNQAFRSRPSTIISPDGFSQLGEQTGNIGNVPSEQNWRPTGRMRGALSGEAYSAALKGLMLDSTQSPHATRPSSQTSVPPGFSPHIQGHNANSRSAHDRRTKN